MIRVLRLFLWFCVGVLISAITVPAFASSNFNVNVPGVSAGSDGLLYYKTPAGGSRIIYPELQLNTPLRIPGLATDIVQLPTKIPVNLARTAGALVGLARLSGPVGLGLTLLPVLCEVTTICEKNPSEYEKRTKTGGYNLNQSTAHIFDSGASACSSVGCTFIAGSDPSLPNFVGRCSYKGSLYDYVYVDPSHQSVVSNPVTESDWQNAVSQLSAATNKAADVLRGLQDLNKPIPVDKPVLSPISQTASPTTSVNRDAAGNVVNTTTSTTTTTVTPVVNNSTTNTVTVNQTTITTTTGPDGSVTNNTQTDSSPPPPDDVSVEFDDVPDEVLQTQQLPLSYSPQSWGEGSCPSDPSVSVMGTPINIPVHVVCTYMSGVRTAVIAFFALISAYIIVGVKFEG